MGTIDVSGRCLQDYQTFTNQENELAARIQSADRWCQQCSESVQHWYDDICVELEESEKIGHLCASNGQYLCYFIAKEPTIFNATQLAIVCGLEFENGTQIESPQDSCTNACRETLQSAVATTGCCFESAFNVSETPEIERRLASYDLWDNCGMNTSTTDFCSERIGTRNCTEADMFQYLQNLAPECVSDFLIQLSLTPDNFEDRVDATERWCKGCAPAVYNWVLNECSDEIVASEIYHVCGHDGNRNCFHYTREERFYQNPVELCRLRSNQTYLPIPTVCPTGCTDALQQLSNDLGCCFENAFNTTGTLSIRHGLANNKLWETCGLDTKDVDICANPFTDSSTLVMVANIHNNIIFIMSMYTLFMPLCQAQLAISENY